MILTSIAAMARNRVIGVNGDLPWNIPEDMKFFRETTKGKIMIMGRKTFESFPAPLPKRFHIVISRQAEGVAETQDVAWVTSLEKAIELARKKIGQYPEEVMVVGGGEIYAQSMSLVDRIHLTVIDKDFQGDTKFPPVDETKFKLVAKSDRTEPVPFQFRTYERVR